MVCGAFMQQINPRLTLAKQESETNQPKQLILNSPVATATNQVKVAPDTAGSKKIKRAAPDSHRSYSIGSLNSMDEQVR